MFGVLRAPNQKLTTEMYQRKKFTYEDAVMYYNPQWIERKALKHLKANYKKYISMDEFLDLLYEEFKHMIVNTYMYDNKSGKKYVGQTYKEVA
jgi:hypothetical protein